MRAFEALVKEQKYSLDGIMWELKTYGRKRSHWIWYVFPTDKAGFSDFAGTRVTRATAGMLCSHQPTVGHWREVLEEICDLVEEKGPHRVLDSIDHGRIDFFIHFWSSLQDSPDWMRTVCSRLGRYKWHSLY